MALSLVGTACAMANMKPNIAPPSTSALADIVYVVDVVEGRNVFINRSVETVLMYSAEEIAELGSDLFPSIIHPDDLPRVGAHHGSMSTLADGESRTIDYRVRRKDGKYLWYRSTDSVYRRDPDGTLRMIVGSAVDISPLMER